MEDGGGGGGGGDNDALHRYADAFGTTRSEPSTSISRRGVQETPRNETRRRGIVTGFDRMVDMIGMSVNHRE